MKNKIFRLALFTLSVVTLMLWAGFIYSMSGQSGDVSTQSSSKVADALMKLLFPNASREQISEFREVIMYPIRKLAHFSEYFILSVLCNITFILANSEYALTQRGLGASILIGVVYAITDELHQSFIPGRVASLTDVAIDSIGVLCGCAVFTVSYLAVIKKARKKSALKSK